MEESVGSSRRELELKAGQGLQGTSGATQGHQGPAGGLGDRGKMRVDQRTDAQQALLGK